MDRRIRALRPPRPVVDPDPPPAWLVEEERTRAGRLEPALTLFLVGAECPFTCVYCDLWRGTTVEATPVGSLPEQIERALDEVSSCAPTSALPLKPQESRLKLYNASNFFDPRSVPLADEPALLELARPFRRLVVESHPAFVGARCLRFAERLEGQLEVAMGLECIHPEVLPRLNKKMTLADFDAAAARLRAASIALRVFVLVAPPFLPLGDECCDAGEVGDLAVAWAVRSAAHAFDQGATRVVLIPTRGGHGEMERLRAAGLFVPPSLAQVEEALDQTLEIAARAGGVVTVDCWDLEDFARCPACAGPRRQRLQRINLTGEAAPRVGCARCGAR